ncbi:class I SAM-dependent DNA methyltransferase [Microlunatus soli]|uniref:Methyltransferase domain-containing protein n=1 Tax=Microlunatus soli TaxID=630515 RepID=A0A1H1WBI1_9ACTN|nr:class I SAM-dependent methyltransferase [Microlunatus soli]SDS94010.1 Methyltransferase domain-containing protein [Microlunatus soli]
MSQPTNDARTTGAAAQADGALQLDGERDSITAYYRDWAASYDQDMLEEGYAGPFIIAGLAAMITDAGSSIQAIDVGCGTGLVGRLLHQRRPAVRILGVDLSEEMAEIAARDDSYVSSLGGVDLLEYAAAEDAPTFPLVLCCGTLTHGHVGVEGLDALLRITSAGGHLAVSVRHSHSVEHGYRDKVAALAAAGAVDVVSELINAPYLDNGGADYWLLRKAAG